MGAHSVLFGGETADVWQAAKHLTTATLKAKNVGTEEAPVMANSLSFGGSAKKKSEDVHHVLERPLVSKSAFIR